MDWKCLSSSVCLYVTGKEMEKPRGQWNVQWTFNVPVDIEEKLIIDDNHNDSERDEKMKQVVEGN